METDHAAGGPIARNPAIVDDMALTSLLLCAVPFVPLPAAAQVTRNALGPIAGSGSLGYHLVDLGLASSVEAVSDTGIAVGYLFVPPFQNVPLLWTNGVASPLPGLAQGNGQARDINEARQIAGWSSDASFDSNPVRWEGRVPVPLGFLGTGTDGQANAINQAGWVVGWSFTEPAHDPQAFFFDGIALHELRLPGSVQGEAFGISDRGEVVGSCVVNLTEEKAFLFNGFGLRELVGIGNPRVTRALDVNAHGTVVGHTERVGLGCCEETLWSLDPMHPERDHRRSRDLRSPGGVLNRCFGLNRQGDVVGHSAGRAFLWRDELFLFLDDLAPAGTGWSLLEATDINAYGQIVGVGELGGQTRGYMLAPLPHLVVDDEVQASGQVRIELTSRPGDRCWLFRGPARGESKAVVDGRGVWLDLAAESGSPDLVHEQTLGPAGSFTLSLAVPGGSSRFHWQAVVLADGNLHRSNRMETLVVPSGSSSR